jgi:hypothetical protein
MPAGVDHQTPDSGAAISVSPLAPSCSIWHKSKALFSVEF